MRQLKSILAKAILAVFALFMAFPNTMVVHAEEVEADLITLEEVKDITVMFTYEGEQPEITFLSPSGKKYEEGVTPQTELAAAHGEGWSSYKIFSAEIGTWRVLCDKKNNEYVDYNIVEEVDGLCIQSFDIVSIEEGKANLSFLVTMGEDGRSWFEYTITAIAGEDESAGKVLRTGSGYTGDTHEVTVDLKLSSYSDYRLLLEVTARQGLEMFDSRLSESFSYVNANTPAAMEDFYVKINTSDHTCEIDWEDFRLGWDYFVAAFADGDTDNPIYTNEPDDELDKFAYPADAEKLTVQVYYRKNDVLSEPVTKEIDLINGELLTIVTPEITASTQLELAYKTNKASLLEVWINDESGQYNIDGEDSVYFPLAEGVNTVRAGFSGDNNISYWVSADIFRDSTLPVLTLFENLDGMTFRKGEAVISGAVKNAAKLTINDAEVVIGEDGVFEHTVALASGANQVTIVATSESGIGTSRSMQITRAGGGVISGSYKDYLPLLIALGVSLIIILYTLIFVRKKDKDAAKPKKPMTYKRFAVRLGIGIFLLDAVSAAGYVYFTLFNNSRRYIELVKESLAKAARYTDYEQYFFLGMLILSGMLVLNLVIGLAVRTIRNKKNKQSE